MPPIPSLAAVKRRCPAREFRAGVQRRVWKKTGFAELDRHARLAVVRALRTGHLPGDPAVHSVLRSSVTYRLERGRKSRRALPVSYGSLLLVAVANALVLGPWFLLLGLWFVALGVYGWVSVRREGPRLAGLERALVETG